MSSFYQKNLNALKKANPPLADALDDLPLDSSFNFSNYQISQNQAQDFLNKMPFENPRLIIFYGFCDGSYLKSFVLKPHFLNETIVVIEKNPQFLKHAMNQIDLTDVLSSKKIFWFVGMNHQRLKKALSTFFLDLNHLRFAKAVEFIFLPKALEYDATYYQHIDKFFGECIAHSFNRYYGDPDDGYIGLKNIFDQMDDFIKMPLFEKAYDSFKNKPGIVIASGPSLNETIKLLKNVGNKAVMVACPSALPALIPQNIKPHIWVHSERVLEHEDIYKNLPNHPEHIFVGEAVVGKGCFKENKGLNTFLLNSPTARWIPIKAKKEPVGHSAAHLAFYVLKNLGCNPIYLFGQDLTYDKNQSHAFGVWDKTQEFMKNKKEDSNRIFKVEGNDGTNKEINLFWMTYLKSFEEEVIPNFKGQVFNVIPKNMGSKIFGAQLLNPDEFENHLKSKEDDVLKILKTKLLKNQNEVKKNLDKKISEVLKKAVKIFDERSEKLKKLVDCGENVLKNCDAITKNWKTEFVKYQTLLEKLDEFYDKNSADKKKDADFLIYNELFYHPILQGKFIRMLMEMYAHYKDLSGDKNAVELKTTLIVKLGLLEIHWLKEVKELILSYKKNQK